MTGKVYMVYFDIDVVVSVTLAIETAAGRAKAWRAASNWALLTSFVTLAFVVSVFAKSF